MSRSRIVDDEAEVLRPMDGSLHLFFVNTERWFVLQAASCGVMLFLAETAIVVSIQDLNLFTARAI